MEPGARDDEQRAIAVGFTAYIVWGLLTVYWKLLRHFDAFDLIGWRVLSACLVMVLVLTAGRRWSHLAPVVRTPRLLVRIGAAAALLTVNWTSYVWAVVHGRVIETALGYFMAPLGTILIGVLVFGEALHRVQRIAAGLVLVAIVVLTASYGQVPFLALAIAASWSLYGWLKKQVPLGSVDGMAAEMLVLLLPAATVMAVLAGRDTSVLSSASAGEVLLVVLSGLATVVPLTMFAHAAPRVPLTILGPLQYTVPLINFVLGWAVYDEEMPAARLAGFALVWAAITMVTVDTIRRARRVRAGAAAVPVVAPGG